MTEPRSYQERSCGCGQALGLEPDRRLVVFDGNRQMVAEKAEVVIPIKGPPLRESAKVVFATRSDIFGSEPTGGGMTVLRIMANIAADTVPDTRKFYSDLFGLNAVMDLGWVVTLASRETAVPQISILSEGGSGIRHSTLRCRQRHISGGRAVCLTARQP